MKQFSQLNYQTEKVQMSTTVLESMISNMGQKIKNMSVKIQFASQQQKRAFLMSEQRIKQQSDAISFCSDHSDEKDENQGQNKTSKIVSIRPKEKKAKGTVEQKRIVQVSFEKSILLKEKYSNHLEKIGRRLNVEFIVVPAKVKIIGIKSDLLDQAYQEFGMLQDKINLEIISNYGKEVFQSKYYKKLFKQSQIQILKILDQYYFWFEDGADLNQLMKNNFSMAKHKIFPLGKPSGSKNRQKDVQAIKVAHGSFSWLKLKTTIINALTIKIEAIIFQKHVQNELNRLQKRIERKVELSEDRQNLILHLDADQQIKIQEDNIRSAYEPFIHAFFLFDKDISLESLAKFLNTYNSISSKDRFRKKKAQPSQSKLFFTERIQNFVVIAYYEEKDKNVTAQNLEAYIQQHQLMQFFKKIPEDLLNFKLVLRSLMVSPNQQGEFKKFSFQKDPNEKITFISCKNQRRKNYQLMIQLFIQKKFISEVIKKQQPTMIETESQNSLSIDLSRPIDQSSIMLNSTNNLSFSMQNGMNASNMSKILPQQLCVLQPSAFRFEEYSLCLLQRPEDIQKRYSDLFDVLQKASSTLKNPQLQKGLNSASASKYRIWGLKVPLKYKQISLRDQADAVVSAHPQLGKYNRQITVFYGGKQLKDFENIYAEDKKLKVYKIEEKSKGKQDIKIKEGYLLKTNVVFLYLQFVQNNGLTELPFGKYEALYYVKKLEP